MSLREAAFDAITESDITAIMKAQVDKAKAGDEKAARFVLDYFTKLPTTTITMGIRGAAAEREPATQPRVITPPAVNGRIGMNGHASHAAAGEPTDEELDRQIEEDLKKHPLYKPSPYMPADVRHNKIVEQRVAAGLPVNHPDDPKPNLE